MFRLRNATLSRRENLLVLASTRRNLEIQEIAQQARSFFGPIRSAGKRDVSFERYGGGDDLFPENGENFESRVATRTAKKKRKGGPEREVEEEPNLYHHGVD